MPAAAVESKHPGSELYDHRRRSNGYEVDEVDRIELELSQMRGAVDSKSTLQHHQHRHSNDSNSNAAFVKKYRIKRTSDL